MSRLQSRKFSRIRPHAVLTLAALAAAVLPVGCANMHRDSVTVGSIPDDYRTNHPIVISEKDRTIDVAVAAGQRRATTGQKATVDGFFARYDRSSPSTVSILTPNGAANDLAAGQAARDFAAVARANGVPESRIVISTYQAQADVSAPVRLSYAVVSAHTNKCGRWPDDLTKNTENKNYANFGCAYQNNLAAQIANPNDLLGPRKESTIDAQERELVIKDYRENSPTLNSPVASY